MRERNVMAKTPDRETQYGRQFPNGAIEWVGDKVALKLGWTTASGRKTVQWAYDAHLRTIGIVPGPATDLRFFSRERFVGYTDAVELIDFDDVTPEPSTGDAPAEQPETWTTTVAVQAPTVEATVQETPLIDVTAEATTEPAPVAEPAVPVIGTVPA